MSAHRFPKGEGTRTCTNCGVKRRTTLEGVPRVVYFVGGQWTCIVPECSRLSAHFVPRDALGFGMGAAMNMGGATG